MDLGQILEATVTGDKAGIDHAEKYLNDAIQQNLAALVVALSDVLAEVTRLPAIRMAAGLRLKNLLTSKDAEVKVQHQQNWANFSDDVRTHVKQKVLLSLGTETISPSSAAQCVAFIACIEIPIGAWPDLLPLLLQGVTNASSTEGLKEASLEAIGYMCEEIDASVLQAASNDILTAIVQGMRKEEQSVRVRLAATKALLNSMEFTKKNFESDQERHFIMQVLCENTQCTDVRVRVAALQNLNQVMCLHYKFMETYMGQALFAITVQAMQSDDDDVALQGIEFWSTVAEEEIDLDISAAEAAEDGLVPEVVSKHYAKGALQFLVPILMLVLTHQDEFDDEDAWKPNKAASVCLMLMATCCEDDIVNRVLPFVTSNVTNEDWKFREAALMAFSSILEGPKLETLEPVIVEAIPVFLCRMDDPSSVVKDTLAYCFGRICELHPEAIIDKLYTGDFFKGVIAGIDAEPTVAGNYCLAISSLAETAYERAETEEGEIPPTYCLSPIFEVLVTKLLAATVREDASSSHLRSSAYEAVMELVKNSPADCYPVVQSTMMVIMQRVQQLLLMAPDVSQENRSQFNDIQSLLCAALQALLRRMSEEDAATLGPEVFRSLISMLRASLTGAVQEDVLMAVGSLVELLGEQFISFMPELKQYLIVALNARNEHDVCFAAVGIVSDLCRSVGKAALVDCASEIVSALYAVLQDDTIQKSIKPQVLSVLGDVALCLGTLFNPYYHSLLLILQAVGSAPVDPDDHEYIIELRESVLEAYIGVVQSLTSAAENGDNVAAQVSVLEPHLGTMLTYVEQGASDPYRTDSHIAVACGLLGDLMKCFGQQLLPFIDKKPVHSLLQEGRSSKVAKTRALALWTSKEIRKLKV
ncbi:importin subunit beta-1-like [Sycon ciliatum]|uniref:importin subunit beta-1-like n=1 Tax=Sycon ciliatum TaxID=27933 RepID=UPI0020A89941|eukprot:scpid25104/ scgid9971/ Importin subunit beta-1; Karyopherin subunit beta-1; Nuclear factor p97; Pore targeting complex 97 kDa subunit; SCG